MEITELLRHAVEVGASDLHLKAGNVPFVRVDGELSPTTFEAMSAADTEAAALALMPEHKRREFEVTSEANFDHTLAGVGRFRITVFRQRSMVGLAIRRVRSEVPTVAELMLPPVMAELAESSRGLVLVTGPTGTGKTTTIASMIGHINRTRRAQRDDRVAAPRDAVRRQGARPRGRGARLDGPCLRPDHRPGGDDRDPRHHRRGCLLRHADVRPGARGSGRERPGAEEDARFASTSPHDFVLALRGTLLRG